MKNLAKAMHTIVVCFALVFALAGQESERLAPQPFQQGCCLDPHFPRPRNVSQSTVPATTLSEALNCATNNRFIGGTSYLARALGDRDKLNVSYYYGTYMPEQDGPALTIVAYSADEKHGVLFDVVWEGKEYSVGNLPPLLRSPKQWRVGEIDGGLWSYTRLWYLAQEIGSRHRTSVPLRAIETAKPKSCHVLYEDQTNWKPGNGKFVGDSVQQAMPQK